MKKGLIVAGIIIAITLASFAGVFYKMQDLEFAGGGVTQVTTSGIDLTVLACNPSLLPQSIDLMQAVLYSQANSIGTFEVSGKTVSAGSQATMDGTITFTDFDSMKNFVGWIVNDQNPQDFSATVLVKTKILDMIPHSYKKSYDFQGFENLLFGNEKWSCQSRQGMESTTDIKQQLSLAQARFAATQLLYSNGILNTTR